MSLPTKAVFANGDFKVAPRLSRGQERGRHSVMTSDRTFMTSDLKLAVSRFGQRASVSALTAILVPWHGGCGRVRSEPLPTTGRDRADATASGGVCR